MSERLLRQLVREHLFEQVRRKFEMDLPADIRQLASIFKDAGHKLYVVGGSVRDALLGKQPKDFDVATDANPDAVIATLERAAAKDPKLASMKFGIVGKAFGIVVVKMPSGEDYEIATFRKDIGKGRRPDSVEFTSIENDVQRRDLTINALFYDIDAGEVVDYVGGLQDIESGIIRAVGDPKERFDEDRLRILRALRFAGRMGTDLDPQTAKAIEEDNNLQGVSPERIRDEFLKGVKSAKEVGHFVDMFNRFDLWPQVFPGLVVRAAPFQERDPVVLLALLLGRNDPQAVQKKLNALKYTADEAMQVSFLLRLRGLTVNNAYRMRKLANQAKLTDVQMESYASEEGQPNPGLLQAFLKYQPTVSGTDLMAQGFSGADLGKELERQETELFERLVGA